MYLIDCKSTSKAKYEEDITIFWTKTEWKYLEKEKPQNYVIARVFNCNAAKSETTFLQVSCIDLDADHEE